jgi:hypothetical protein
MVLFHVGAVAALFNFTWSGLIVLLATYYVSLAWGIGMAYHRLLTHRSYKTPKLVEYFLTICATLALEGGPLFWVATHRQHHQHSDADPDPHTPRHGGFWAHIGWIMFGNLEHNDVTRTSRYAPDLGQGRLPPLDQQVPLGAAAHTRAGLPRPRSLGLGSLGHFPEDDDWPARDLAREFSHAHVGWPPIRNPR